MSDEIEIEVTDDTIEDSSRNPLLDVARKVFLAGVGAVVLAQESVTGFVGGADNNVNKFVEDVEAFVGKLVERGEIAEQDGRQLVKDLLNKRKETAEKVQEAAQDVASQVKQDTESGVAAGVGELATKLNIPTKNDIESLTSKIAQLSDKVDELQATQADPVEEAVAVTEPDILAE